MKTKVKVGDIMNSDFVSIPSHASLKEAVKKMLGEGVASIVLKDGGKLKGFLTEKNVLLVLGRGELEDLDKVRAKDIAREKMAIIEPSSDIYEALKKMSQEKIRWLPVVNKGEIVGLLTLNDIVEIEPSLLEIFHSRYT